MMVSLKATDASKFGTLTESAMGKMNVIETAGGGKHFYTLEEVKTYASLINLFLKDDPDLKDCIPINTENEDIFHVMDDGAVLCKLMRVLDPDCILEKAITTNKDMGLFQKQQNLNMGIAAAKGVGFKMVGVSASDFLNKTPHLILTFVWQNLRAIVAKSITLKDTPEIIRLAKEGEDLRDLQKLPVEELLIRWINFHLKEAGQSRRVANLGKDLKDSEALFYVLNQLDKSKCPLDGKDTADLTERATKMIENSANLGVPEVIGPSSIVNVDVKSNTLFVATIFNTRHGLEELTEEEYKKAGFTDDDVEGAKEERVYRMWINSLNLEGVFVNDLYDDVKDGVLLCKVIDKLQPGLLDWKKVDQAPKNDFNRNINSQQAVDACKALKFKLVAVGGNDFTKGNKTPILALVWQLVRFHYLQLIGGKSDEDLIKWANECVGDKHPPIANLKDKGMANGYFLMRVLESIEPRAIDWEIMQEGDSEEALKNNAKYVISVARSFGAVIFAVWEDFVQVNPKQMLIFLAVINEIAMNKK